MTINISMALQNKPFFNDSQVKRYILQIMSAFSGYQVQTGKQRDGKSRFINVPIMFGTYDRLVQYLRQDANINQGPSLPIMSLEVTGLQQKDELRRAPEHSSIYTYRQRGPATMEGVLGSEPGKLMMAERPMPVPYDMKVGLNIWASNMDQILQLTEQIGSLYNPQLDLKMSDSPADWTMLSYLKFDGDIRFRRAALDIGTGGPTDQLHLAELNFETLVHLSQPTKVFEAKYIDKIRTTFSALETDKKIEDMEYLDGFVLKVEDTNPELGD